MFQLPPPTISTAEDLLVEFEQTGATAPFEEIVRRYSGMVYGVCYRVTRNAHDAEDATQATFLKLATYARMGFASTRAAGGPTPRIGPWLQQVAKTTAVDLRRSKTRRQNREQIRAAIEDQQQPSADATDDVSMDELKQVLRDEVDRLPVHYRTPLILYYFGGLSTEQIAVELKTNAKALAVRLFRARKMLGTRLTARGIATAGGSIACLAVADSILAALAGKVWQTAGTSGIYGSMYASAGGGSWLTSHSAVVSTIAGRINATLRATAVGLVASKWKMSIAMLLTVGTTMAGTSEVVQQAPVVRDVARWLHDIGQSLRELGNFGRNFQGNTPRLQAQAKPAEETAPPVALAPLPWKLPPIEPAAAPTSRDVEAWPKSLVTVPSNRIIALGRTAAGQSQGEAGISRIESKTSAAGGRSSRGSALAFAVGSGGSSAGQSLLAMNDGNREAGRNAAAAAMASNAKAGGEFVGPVALATTPQADFQQLLQGSSQSRFGPFLSTKATEPGSPSSPTEGSTEIATGPTTTGPAATENGIPGFPGVPGLPETDPIGLGTTTTTPTYGSVVDNTTKSGILDGVLPGTPMVDPTGPQFIDGLPSTGPIITSPTTQPIPEPAAIGLLAAGAAGLLLRRRRTSR
ncbi:RNA polymerase sigma factor [Humisphaera borealis]|uniref:RNA polymerase sigma factor n=1 Tax=Humisphaera borealis TaxID=2807512 RepID=A0A7M2WX74_9BACT|nr:RNA polymerase sigma factor [Humisphaera borealis]QOV89802.1 RNA polymerase sigma factor [Humisphaera borealis]